MAPCDQYVCPRDELVCAARRAVRAPLCVAANEADMNHADIIEATRRWIAAVVIGLDLCPFAQRAFVGERIRYVVSAATDSESLRAELAEELRSLAATPIDIVETTLLIHPRTLTDFGDYCDFLAEADRMIKSLGLRGVIQIASFHPEYQFADSGADAVENYTNRSPHPMLHLLREESVSKLSVSPEELAEIPRKNIATLRGLGLDAVQRLRRG